VVAVFDYFSRKFKQAEGEPMPWSRKWRLALMLSLLVVSLGLSGFGFYRAIRPKIVEKIVDKPVDRIIERTVQPEASGAMGSRDCLIPAARTFADQEPLRE
jgi:hypothetical protein